MSTYDKIILFIYLLISLGHVRGKYKYKEEVIKKVEHDHPCKLTQTAVKITFPGMKEQLLVSFLGYKEPNLMPVQRCKGLCGSGNALSPVACVPTKLRYNKVKMQIMTQYLGHDAKQRYRELVLEEHEECGCRCLNVRPEHCMEPSLFNNETCSCKCDTSLYNRDQIQCETLNDRTWDPLTCTCRRTEELYLYDRHGNGPKQIEMDTHQLDLHEDAEEALREKGEKNHYHNTRHHHKKQIRPGHDIEQDAIVGCGGDNCQEEFGKPPTYTKNIVAVMPKSPTASSSNNGWTAIGVCTFLVVVFATTTIYYWQKAKKMAKDMFANEKSALDDDLGDNDDDLEIEVPSPPPKPNGKKQSLIVGSQEDLTVVTSPMHSTTTQILLNNRNNCVKSPIQLNSSEKFVKLCDNNKKQQNNLNNSVNLPPPPASPRSPRRSTSAALDYQNAVRYLNWQKNPPCKINVGF